MIAPSPSPLSRRSRLQFSLRLLLAVFTAFAIGFPIWYRWPYEEVEVVYPKTRSVGEAIMTLREPDKTQPPDCRITNTWQRNWGSLRPSHIRTVTETFEIHLRQVQHYRDGQLHGPSEFWMRDTPFQVGQYEHGQRSGEWVDYRGYGDFPKSTARWSRGRLDGPYVME